jgi:cytochrome c55X
VRALGPYLFAGFCGTAALAPGFAESMDEARRSELRHLILHDCGSCHGMRLTGGLGPPLTPEALRDRPNEVIVNTVLHGRTGTAMPGWRPMLSEADAAWIAAALKQGVKHAR